MRWLPRLVWRSSTAAPAIAAGLQAATPANFEPNQTIKQPIALRKLKLAFLTEEEAVAKLNKTKKTNRITEKKAEKEQNICCNRTDPISRYDDSVEHSS